MHRFAPRGTERLRSLTAIVLAFALMGALAGCGGGSPTQVTPTTPPAPSGANEPATTEETTTPGAAVPAGDEEDAATPGVPMPVAWGEINTLVSEGARLVSCDTAADFAGERVKGAVNVPLKDLDSISPEWNKSDVIVLTSLTEATSRSGAGHLARKGFESIYYLEGGHDEWKGTFEGSMARRITIPPKVIYIHNSDPDIVVVVGDVTSEKLSEMQAELLASMESLEDEFADFDFVSADYHTDPNAVTDLIEQYDIPPTLVGGFPIVLVPRWVLVDSDGTVSHLTGLPLNINSQILYAWCVEQAGR